MKDIFKNWKTIPNLLSFLRIVMVPIFAVLFYRGELLWALFVLFLSGASDFFDGKIARRFNQISDLGKVLDPVADKLTQITIAIMLFIVFNRSSDTLMKTYSWVFLLFIVKELFMVIIGGIMLILNLRPSAAEIYGKAATLMFYVVMIAIIAFGPEVGAVTKYFPSLVLSPTVTLIFVVLSAVLTIVALASYFPGTIKQFKERKNNNQQVANNK